MDDGSHTVGQASSTASRCRENAEDSAVKGNGIFRVVRDYGEFGWGSHVEGQNRGKGQLVNFFLNYSSDWLAATAYRKQVRDKPLLLGFLMFHPKVILLMVFRSLGKSENIKSLSRNPILRIATSVPITPEHKTVPSRIAVS